MEQQRPQPNILLTNTYSYAHAADVYIDDERWASLNVNSYASAQLAPGKYTFSVRDNIARGPLAELEVEVLAGQQYYCRYDFHFGLATNFALRVIPEKLAKPEIAKTNQYEG